MERPCEYCNEPFEPKRSDALYCGSGCRQLAYVLRKAQNNPITKELNYPSTQIMVEKDLLNDEPNTSTQIIKNSDYPSIQQREAFEDSRNLTINTDKREIESEGEKLFIEYDSSFIQDLKVLTDKRVDNLDFFREDENLDCEWVNIRYRCLIESLLTLSEMQSVKWDDLKEICNAFTAMIHSSDYDCLHEYYPYLKDIVSLWQSIKHLCLEADEKQPLNFKLRRSTKLDLIVTRWELAHFVRKENFSQLNFEE